MSGKMSLKNNYISSFVLHLTKQIGILKLISSMCILHFYLLHIRVIFIFLAVMLHTVWLFVKSRIIIFLWQ